MGVATRGVNYKFSTGENVLCYEPDPSKAKVLYESRVLDCMAGRDERGKKTPEYLIHFLGWNSSWDRFVREEFILSVTEENRELQRKLAEEAASAIRGKHKYKQLPPLIKETLNKKAKEKAEGAESIHSSSLSELSEEEEEEAGEVELVIPDLLRRQLEEDWRCVCRRSKLVQLPCVPCVATILNNFLQNVLSDKKLVQEDKQNKVSLYREAVEGLRVCFDAALPTLLLYAAEKEAGGELLQFGKIKLFVKMEPHEAAVKTEPDVKPPLNPQPELEPKRKRGRPKLVPKRSLRSGEKPLVVPAVRRRGRPTPPAVPALLPLPSPSTPSQFYGAQHLLRLFVKLPDLLCQMGIPNRKLQLLTGILEHFLAYLCEHRTQLFQPSAYVDK